MMTAAKAARMVHLIPDRGPAVITLNPDTETPTTVNVSGAWIMQADGGMGSYGSINIQTAKTIIKFLDSELNPFGEGREIRFRDTITFSGQLYRVTEAGGNLTTILTTWEVDVQKEFG